MLHFAHIVNPVKAVVDTELYRVQPIVFRSMEVAQAQATDLRIELLAVCYPEDVAIVPSYLNLLPPLTRSILDVKLQENTKKLPYIKEILDALYKNSQAEYLIYTNADIILQPYFYQAVASYIQDGHDALIINRRRISPIYDTPSQLPQIWAEVGSPHPGFDCFVFHRTLYPKFVLGDILIGTPFIEATLAHNIFAHSQNYLLLNNHHLTAHLGMEVMPQRSKELYWLNRNAFFKNILPALKPYLSDSKLPYANDTWLGKQVRRILNPAIFTALSIELEGKSYLERLKWYTNELRWKFISKR
ncbi:hypothetical protein BH09BAC1_BH09BAC1_11270 [soil metagenome]